MDRYFKLFALSLAAFLSHSCNPNAPDYILHDRILNKLNKLTNSFKAKKSAYAVLDMDTLSGLDWERLYFFQEDSGYPTDESISELIGIKITSGSIISNGTRLIFTKSAKVLAVVDFSQEENLWIYAVQGYSRNQGNKFAFYTNCNYRKSYNIQPMQNFDEHKDLSGSFYNRCY